MLHSLCLSFNLPSFHSFPSPYPFLFLFSYFPNMRCSVLHFLFNHISFSFLSISSSGKTRPMLLYSIQWHDILFIHNIPFCYTPLQHISHFLLFFFHHPIFFLVCITKKVQTVSIVAAFLHFPPTTCDL